jgi:hypothetical protein
MSGKIIKSTSKVVTLLLLMILVSCKTETVGLSDIPRIEFESFRVIKSVTGADSLVEITIYYEDGNGDIGLSQTDTAPPFNYGGLYYHNLPIIYLVNKNGVYEEVKHPSTNELYGNQHERIPVLSEDGIDKAITGTIKVLLTANPYDTNPEDVQFEIKLIDRELNISNSVITPSLQLIH